MNLDLYNFMLAWQKKEKKKEIKHENDEAITNRLGEKERTMVIPEVAETTC